MPTISVIVPVYNVDRYLIRCINSILNQRFTDFELVLIDDGSCDCCGYICDKYALLDNRVKVVHGKNRGASVARNIGIKISTGTYLYFCDSDDYIDCDFLEIMLNGMVKENGDLAVCGYRLVDENESVLDIEYEKQNCVVIRNWEEQLNLLVSILRGKPTWCVWRRLFKAHIIRTNEIEFCETSENYAEDLSFVLVYLLYCNSIVCIDYIGYYYVQRSGSLIHKNKNTYRLNALNENSVFFHSYFKSYMLYSLPRYEKRRTSSLLHFLLMNTEYERIQCSNKLCGLNFELAKILNKRFFIKWTALFVFQGKWLKRLFSDEQIHKMKCLSFYCLHRRYKLFCILDSIFYKCIYKDPNP